MRISDWSSDVCSSDLTASAASFPDPRQPVHHRGQRQRILALHRAMPGVGHHIGRGFRPGPAQRRDQPRRSEEHTSELQSLMRISYAVFCLKKKKTYNKTINTLTINPKP